jgi:hypothetical protein
MVFKYLYSLTEICDVLNKKFRYEVSGNIINLIFDNTSTRLDLSEINPLEVEYRIRKSLYQAYRYDEEVTAILNDGETPYITLDQLVSRIDNSARSYYLNTLFPNLYHKVVRHGNYTYEIITKEGLSFYLMKMKKGHCDMIYDSNIVAYNVAYGKISNAILQYSNNNGKTLEENMQYLINNLKTAMVMTSIDKTSDYCILTSEDNIKYYIFRCNRNQLLVAQTNHIPIIVTNNNIELAESEVLIPCDTAVRPNLLISSYMNILADILRRNNKFKEHSISCTKTKLKVDDKIFVEVTPKAIKSIFGSYNKEDLHWSFLRILKNMLHALERSGSIDALCDL